MRARLPHRAAVLAVVVLLVYPYAFYLYGPMYADSLFLLSAVGAFALLERRWYLAAGLVGALATAGRPVGVAVVAGLVVRTLELLAQDRNPPVAAALEQERRPWPGWREVLAAVRDVRARHSFVYNALIRAMFGTRVRDINFAFKLVSRRVLDHVVLRSEGSFIDAELTIRAQRGGFEILQIGVDYFPRTRGVSTLSSVGVIRTMLGEMWRLRRELRDAPVRVPA